MAQVPENIIAQYENSTVIINPFSQVKMGLKTGQAVVKVENYSIICVPYRLSLKNAVLIASFSKDEINYFQKYINGLVGLSLAFHQSASSEMKILARCNLKSINPMQGKESVGLIDLQFKPCPPDLLTTLCNYFQLIDRLKAGYNNYKNLMVAVNPENSKLMGYNNYAVLNYGGADVNIALYSLSSVYLDFIVPINGPDLIPETECKMKLFFRSFQFSVQGTILTVQRLDRGIQKARMTIQFSLELVSILDAFKAVSKQQ